MNGRRHSGRNVGTQTPMEIRDANRAKQGRRRALERWVATASERSDLIALRCCFWILLQRTRSEHRDSPVRPCEIVSCSWEALLPCMGLSIDNAVS